MTSRRTRILVAGSVILLAGGLLGGGLFLSRVRRITREAASAERLRAERVKPLSFRPLPASRRTGVAVVGDGTVAAITSSAVAGGTLWTAGGSGLSNGSRVFDTTSGLPSLRLSAVASWRGTPVFAAERAGFGRVGAAGLEEATSGWGRLEVRVLLETEGGELLIGARQGLFRAAHSAGELELLDAAPVRALALLPGGTIAAGGEKGLRIVPLSGRGARPVASPDPWIEDLGADGETLWAATPLGVAKGRVRAGDDTPLSLIPHPRGGDGTRGVLAGGAWRFVPVDGAARLASLRLDGARSEEITPERFRRLFAAGGELLADGPSGLWRRTAASGWTLARKRQEGSLPHAHVNALAADGPGLWAGFFDAGLAHCVPARGAAALVECADLPGSEAWGVNAVLPSGGGVYAATLRGAVRVANGRATLLNVDERGASPGGAFSLATTASGVAVGYGLGVLLPGQRLLSAFHGLPGNQAYALASAPSSGGSRLWVGTPSGLGRIEGQRVLSRVTSGEGKLPHPWITALAELPDGALLVATYGGGVARRTGEGAGERWERFAETGGLKVNAGALLVDPEGRVWIGTQGQGLFRSDAAVTRFEHLDLPLPSPDVFALAATAEALFVGTDEGLARFDPRRPEGDIP
jgi:hypothetical protein